MEIKKNFNYILDLNCFKENKYKITKADWLMREKIFMKEKNYFEQNAKFLESSRLKNKLNIMVF